MCPSLRQVGGRSAVMAQHLLVLSLTLGELQKPQYHSVRVKVSVMIST